MVLTGLRVGTIGCAVVLRGGGGGTGLARCACRWVMYLCKLETMLFSCQGLDSLCKGRCLGCHDVF
jgi:hypothetical protein